MDKVSERETRRKEAGREGRGLKKAVKEVERIKRTRGI